MPGKIPNPASLFPYVLGLADGMLTALVLASGKVLGGSGRLDAPMAVRISAASALSGAFVFFTAEYIRLRGGLVHAEQQLSLRKAGRLASTRLGRWALREATFSAAVSSVCNFTGALLPLLCGALLPGPAWLAVAFTVAVLGILGVIVAYAVHGSLLRWGVGLMIAGGALALAGAKLRVM